jgi:hypothetical protein
MQDDHNDPCSERRLDMAKEMHDLNVSITVMNREHLAKMQAVEEEIAAAKLRDTKNGDSRGRPHPILQWIAVVGAMAALATTLVLYHNNFALPAVRTATKESIQQLLQDPLFWAQVKEVARAEAYKIADERRELRDREYASILKRIESNEARIEENTRYLDSLGRRKLPPGSK